MLLQLFHMRFDGSFSNSWRCEVSQQTGETNQITASETSVLATRQLTILGFPDCSYRNNDDGSSHRGMTVFLAASRERSSRDGMAYGSLIDCESQKIKKTVLSTAVGGPVFLHEVLWFMSVSPGRGLMRRTWELQRERLICLNKRRLST